MKRLILILALIAGLFIAQAHPILATELPDSISVVSVFVARNTVVDGDMAIVFHYNIEYETYPDDPASDTIIFRLYDPTGTYILASKSPYVYFNNGYGNGVASFYFEESPTWGLQYKINITGSPVFFDPLPSEYNYAIPNSSYCSSSNQSVNQEFMASYIITVCEQLQIAYEDYTLYGSTDTGVVLSSLGELYFRGAIPGIQSMAPSLFLTQAYVPETEYIDTDLGQADTYAERLEDTDIMEGLDAIGDEAGIPGEAVAGGGVFIVCIGAVIFTTRKGWGVNPGLIVSAILLAASAVILGGANMVVGIVLALIAAILIFFMIFFKRS